MNAGLLRKTFKTMIDDKEVELAIVSPSSKVLHNAQLHYGKIFADALKNGALLKVKLESFMREQDLWNDTKESEYNTLNNQLRESALKLKKGGIRLKEARRLSLEMRKLRFKLRNLVAERVSLDSNTAEGQADNSRFNFIVSQCLVYNDTDDLVFETFDNFIENMTADYVVQASRLLSSLLYGLDDNYERNLPENKFLLDWKFVDEKLRLINEKGQFVNEDDHLVNEDGFLINEKGEFVDINNNVLTETGNFAVESKPFLDDDDKPIEKSIDK
jgi:hypothetical protein